MKLYLAIEMDPQSKMADMDLTLDATPDEMAQVSRHLETMGFDRHATPLALIAQICHSGRSKVADALSPV